MLFLVLIVIVIIIILSRSTSNGGGDDDIQDIYVVKGNDKKKIADKIPGNCYTTYYYKDLAAITDDKKFKHM